ncbi:MAG: 3-hydroxyacyl-CoA dehydrogenase NAD-binding domain-containing protein [Thermodesulfobacteriota bacterium]|nr:3-hydroxyacyl-CoA dehydrogenase NAD-binding domain-containing protein [Thermodesulfobacteriota bacterium]
MNIGDLKTVSVIGAGDMGHGIAEVALLAGYKVFLRDIKQEFVDKGAQRIKDSLKKLLARGNLAQELYDTIESGLLAPVMDMKDAVKDADLVIEVVPEVVGLKKDVFAEVESFAPHHAILASNTSSISITDIATATTRPEKVVGLHFFNPVVIMKLVEVIKAEKTSEETMDVAYEFCLKINKIPVRAEKDVPGFIVNRINAPAHILRGCFLDDGIVEPEELDALMRKEGFPMGPCELLDFVGLDVHRHVLLYYAENLHSDYKPYRALDELVNAGNYGKKTGKGFYDWSKGRPDIDLSKATDKIDPLDITAVQINEATKLVEMGVCCLEDIDVAILNAGGLKVGPMEIAKKINPAELTCRLEKLDEKFKKEIFQPTDTIRKGTYR